MNFTYEIRMHHKVKTVNRYKNNFNKIKNDG